MTFHLKVCTVTLVLIVALAVSAAAAGPAVTWSKLSTPNSPSARSGSAMTYDPISKKIVLFGGFSASGYLNDTWTFDGKTWTKQSTPTAPPSRTASTMAFDRVARQVVMFGGYNGHNYLGDTWTWDGATSTWSQASPTNSPEAVTSPMLFTDPLSGRVDVFGGFDGQFYQLTTYQWTGTDWKKLNPPATAFARSTAIVALNQVTKKVVMFGGLGDVNTFNTWTWDGTTWAQNTPATQPPNRYSSAGVFDPALNAVIIFGGGAGGVDLSDTWVWTGLDWKPLAPSQSPPARELFGMAYDSAYGHVVIFGGQAGNGFFNDTWILLPH
ncbi:MAG TPA: kelch repeat-containing protein [Terriglobales bacterium]|nr:kelch repeat-containing protein [Terriglobales bacterium]